MGATGAYFRSIRKTAFETGKTIRAVAGIVTLAVSVVAWWKFGLAWGLVALLVVACLVLFVTGLHLQAEVGRLGGRVLPTPLQPHHEQVAPYRVPKPSMPWIIGHRVGVLNPGSDTVHGVKIALIKMEPHPRNINYWQPVIPYGVPPLTGGDASVGISLAPGHEELWLLGYTGTGSDGIMTAGGWAVPDQLWHGLPWIADPDERWRFSYRITSEERQAVEFSVVVFPDQGELRCEFQG